MLIPIPDDPAVVGASVFSQWAVFEGPTAFPPITFTNAWKLTAGPKQAPPFETIANSDLGIHRAALAGGYASVVTGWTIK